MSPARAAVAGSWVASTALIALAIFSTPYMQKVWRGEAVESRGEALIAVLLVAVICGWPWLMALLLPPRHTKRQYAFSAVALVLAAVSYFPIASGHDFEIGLYTIICVLGIWIVYPITRLVAA